MENLEQRTTGAESRSDPAAWARGRRGDEVRVAPGPAGEGNGPALDGGRQRGRPCGRQAPPLIELC